MSDEPAPAETEPTAPAPEEAPAKPKKPRKAPRPPKTPKTPEQLLLGPARSLQIWSTVFLLLSALLLLALVFRREDAFSNGPLGAVLLLVVWGGLWVKHSRDYTVLKTFVRHPDSVFWIQCVEPAAWCELAPWRWLFHSRRFVFFTLGGARAEAGVPGKRFDETVAWLRSLNAAALDFRPGETR